MNILFYGLNYAPEIVGVAKYTTEMAEWLAERGHRVTVVTSHPYYPSWKIFPGYRSRMYHREQLNGVDLIRCPLYVPTRQTGFRRVVHLASFVISSLPVMLREAVKDHDIIVVIAPTIGVAPTAVVCSLIRKLPVWLHIQDFETEMAFHLGLLPSKRMKWIMDRLEALLYRLCDRVSTISEGMDGVCAAKGVEKEKRELFPNWVDPAVIHPVKRNPAILEQFGLNEDAFVVLYSGTIACKHDIDVLISASDLCADDTDIQFLICGEGAAKNRITSDVAGRSNITMLPLQPPDMLNDLLNIADVHVLPLMSEVRDYVMPSRLTGMCASGRPVICLVERGSYLADAFHDGVIVIQPGDSSSLCQEIRRLKDNPDISRKLGNMNRQYAVDHFNKMDILTGFEKSLSVLIGKTGTNI